MKTLKEKHERLISLIGKDEAVRKLHGFYNRAIKKTMDSGKLMINNDEITIIDHLNLVTGFHYRVTNTETRKLIRARLKEKFTVEDFKKVHIEKARQWLKDIDRRRYLRPATLYNASHFEGYLQEYIIRKKELDERERKKKLNNETPRPHVEARHALPLQEKNVDKILRRLAEKKKL